MDGLENVVVADTTLSDVDGINGRLVIKGHSLDEMAGRMSFEAAAALLWTDLFDDLPDTDEFASRLGLARAEVFDGVDALRGELRRRPPIEAMRALIAQLADSEDRDTAFRLLAAPAVYAPAVIRVRQGLAPIAPEPGIGQSADIIRMLSGKAPSPAQVAALDTYLVTVIDHGLNASTFAARVTASTRAGLTSARARPSRWTNSSVSGRSSNRSAHSRAAAASKFIRPASSSRPWPLITSRPLIPSTSERVVSATTTLSSPSM